MNRTLAAGLLAVVLLGLSACRGEEPNPIKVGTDRITVTNRTPTPWRDVEVWLNDHYRAQARDLAPGQRLEVPLGIFVAGFGQRFDAKKQTPFGVEVEAVAADGKPVRLKWGRGRRR